MKDADSLQDLLFLYNPKNIYGFFKDILKAEGTLFERIFVFVFALSLVIIVLVITPIIFVSQVIIYLTGGGGVKDGKVMDDNF